MKSRDRFEDAVKVFDPDAVKISNFAKHSPRNPAYDTERAQSKIVKERIKRENAQYTFSKTPRYYESTSKRYKDAQPGPGMYEQPTSFGNKGQKRYEPSCNGPNFTKSRRRFDVTKIG